MKRYKHYVQAHLDPETNTLLRQACTQCDTSMSRFVRYAIQPFHYSELAEGNHDWNDTYHSEDLANPRTRPIRIVIMLSDPEYEMLCRAAYKQQLSRSTYIRNAINRFLARDPIAELDGIDDQTLRANATTLLTSLAHNTTNQ